MTKKQYNKICRIKVEHYAKILSCSVVLILISFGYAYDLNGWGISALSVLTWFFAPDLIAYVLECYYKIRHDFTSYR